MITVLNVCMFSGMCHTDPKCEISPEETQEIIDLVRQLELPPQKTFFGMGLGSDSFSVIFTATEMRADYIGIDFNPEKYPEVYTLRCHPGYVKVVRFRNNTWSQEEFADHVGLHALLTKHSARAFANYQQYIAACMAAPPQIPFWMPSWDVNPDKPKE